MMTAGLNLPYLFTYLDLGNMMSHFLPTLPGIVDKPMSITAARVLGTMTVMRFKNMVDALTKE
jgi:hypothetical protein